MIGFIESIFGFGGNCGDGAYVADQEARAQRENLQQLADAQARYAGVPYVWRSSEPIKSDRQKRLEARRAERRLARRIARSVKT